jgi:xanthine/uracil permease
MDSKLYLTIVAVLGVLYGIMFVLFPSDSLAFYGVTGQPYGEYNIQFFGSALLSLGVIAWYARSFRDWDAVRAVLIGGLVGDIVGLFLGLWGIRQGLVNAMGWSSVVVYVLLIAGAVYCLRGKVAQTA